MAVHTNVSLLLITQQGPLHTDVPHREGEVACSNGEVACRDGEVTCSEAIEKRNLVKNYGKILL